MRQNGGEIADLLDTYRFLELRQQMSDYLPRPSIL